MADPLLDNASLLKPGNVNVPVNEGAMTARAEAAGNMGRAVQGIGERGFSLAQKIQEAENSGQLADMRRRMRETLAEFERDTLTNTDESTWKPKLDQQFERLQSDFEKEGMAPAVREQFHQQFADFRGNASLRLQERALQQSLDRSKQRHIMAADQALLAGDVAAYEQEIDAIPGALPEWKDRVKQEGRQRHAFDVIKAKSFEDPEGVAEDVRAGKYDQFLSEGDRKALLADSENQLNRLKAEEAKGILDAYRKGQLPTDKEIGRELAESQYLNEEDKKKFMETIRSTEPVTPEERSELKDRMHNLVTNRLILTKDGYEKEYWKLQRDLWFLGGRVGAEKLREQAGGISPENLSHLATVQQGNHAKALARKADAVSADKAAEFSYHPEIHQIRNSVDDYMEKWILDQPDPSKVGPDEIKAEAHRAWDDAIMNGPLKEILPPDPPNPLDPESLRIPPLGSEEAPENPQGMLLPPKDPDLWR